MCNNESIPVRMVVMLSQEPENRAERLTPGHAFPLLYSQITVNKWNMQDHLHTIDLIEEFLGSVPVLHLGCIWMLDASEGCGYTVLRAKTPGENSSVNGKSSVKPREQVLYGQE